MGQEGRAPVGNLERWCKRAQRALGKFNAIPTAMRLVLICIAVLVVFSVTNLVYQILHKPTEVFALIPGESNKAPIETWEQYAPLFREYSTASISPELLGVFTLLFVGGIMVLNGKTEIGIVVAFISGLDRVIDPWRELIAFVRSTSAAKVQFDLIEGTLGRKL